MGKATKKQVAFASKISKTLNISLPEQLTFETMQKFINTHIDEYMNINYTALGERIKNEVSILDYVPLAGFTLKKIGNHKLYDVNTYDPIFQLDARIEEEPKRKGFFKLFGGKNK